MVNINQRKKTKCTKHLTMIIFMCFIITLSTSVHIASTENDLDCLQIKKKLTMEDIKKNYAGKPIINITQFNDKYVLVEWQIPTLANRFDLYNLETGEKDILPTLPYYVSSPEIVNEYRFVFLADGRNHHTPQREFPFLIECIMDRIEPVDGTRFGYTYKAKYFPLSHKVEFGLLKNQLVADIIVSHHNIKILFEPLFEGYFAGPDIPPTKTSFIEEDYQFIITIEDTQPKYDLVARSRGFSGYYIKEVKFVRDLKNTIIAVTLERDLNRVDSPPLYYTGYHGAESTFGKMERPFVQFTFSTIEGPENWWKK